MLTPIERMHQQALAAQEAETVEAQTMAEMPEYNRLLMVLDGHRRYLSSLQGRDAKTKYKIEILPDFVPYVDGVLSAGNGTHDEILVTVLVWRIDTGDIAGAMDIAKYAIPLGLDSPSNFKRDLKNTVTEEIAEYILDHQDMDNGLELLDQLYLLVDGMDMVDEVSASLNKALGILHEAENPQEAANYYTEALRLNDKCGLKGRLRKLNKMFEKQKNTPATEAAGAE